MTVAWLDRPAAAWNPNRGIYHFRWIWDYAGGQMTNLGQHSLDIVQWFTGVKAPKSVYSTGGRTYLKDNMETPDSQDVLIDYPGFTGICVYREATAGREGLGMGGVMFYGTRGMMSVGRSGYRVMPDRRRRRSRGISTGPRRWRTPPATARKTTSRIRVTSSSAFARASSPSPTSRARTRW
jgi:predicted dehydrogenase